MQKLSKKEYWDSIYKKDRHKAISQGTFLKMKEWLKNISRDYSNFLIWEYIYPRYLPQSKNLKVIEIGCAPGGHLIGLHNKFGYVPYGVEYSEPGSIVTKNNFIKAGLPDENIMHADFFDDSFQSQNLNSYDMVLSLGFVEHFDDPGKVIDLHLKLVKYGGYLIILIPNFKGVNNFILRFLNLESLLIHNISIMDHEKFRTIFEGKGLEHLFCDYVGTLSFGLFNTDKIWKYYLWRMLLIIQRPFDLVWRVLFGSRYLRCQYSSPYLLYIGRKMHKS